MPQSGEEKPCGAEIIYLVDYLFTLLRCLSILLKSEEDHANKTKSYYVKV